MRFMISERRNLSLKAPKKLLHVFLLILAFAWTTSADAKAATNSETSHALNLSSSSNSSSLSSLAPTISNTSTVILSETELYDGSSWQPVSWTDASTGETAPSPSDYPDPLFGKWISEWKIVTGPTRDEFGWEYKTNRRRKRTWLRTYEIVSASDANKRATTRGAFAIMTSPFATAATSRRNVSPIAKLARSIRDSYNFKGFGLTFYKSLVFRQSFGMALRVPITFNFNLWEEHPSLPGVGASIAVYHPWVVCVFINISLRMEVIQWAMTTSVATVVYVTFWLVWTLLLRGLIVAGGALFFPVTRKFYQPAFPLAKPNWQGPDFSRSVEERLGMSWSWRFSKLRGFEHRVGYSHYFAHSLVALLKARNIQKIPSWMVRRVVAVGTGISGPIHDQPYITANGLLSLSGLYFSRRNRQVKTPSKIEESVAAALTVKQPMLDVAPDGENVSLDDDAATNAAIKSLPLAKLVPQSKSKSKVPS
ncbi:hypothetical protein MPSEU_000110000 [Mayamaea pseudoterrestris]|nr:hypothetical protein MPSEU_000110000 [Mayamaea pseudoterrestris]